MTITGHITYQDIEGGFWGIVADDGARYVPVEPLPAEWKRENRPVQATVRPANVLGMTMWGAYVHVEKLDYPDQD